MHVHTEYCTESRCCSPPLALHLTCAVCTYVLCVRAGISSAKYLSSTQTHPVAVCTVAGRALVQSVLHHWQKKILYRSGLFIPFFIFLIFTFSENACSILRPCYRCPLYSVHSLQTLHVQQSHVTAVSIHIWVQFSHLP